MRVGSLDAPKIATELGARSGASGCAVIVGAIAAEPGAGASKSEMRFGATLSAAFRLCGLAAEMAGDQWPGRFSSNGGACSAQKGNCRIGQWVWKWPPEGGLIGFGTS